MMTMRTLKALAALAALAIAGLAWGQTYPNPVFSGYSLYNGSTLTATISSNVEGTGIAGIDNGYWFLFNQPSTFNANPTLRVDRRITNGSGISGNTYKALWVYDLATSTTNQGYEWAITGELHNKTPQTTGAQNVAVNGTAFKETPTNTSTTSGLSGGLGGGVTYSITSTSQSGLYVVLNYSGGVTFNASHSILIAGATPTVFNGVFPINTAGSGTLTFLCTACIGFSYTSGGVVSDASQSISTVTFAGGATIPVNDSIVISGVTPSLYNGTWQIISSSSGSASFYCGACTGSQTVAGTVVDTSVGTTWGGNLNCTDNTTENNPVANCVGVEIDVSASTPTLDNNRQRVGALVAAGGPAGAHVGYGILEGASTGVVIDRGMGFSVGSLYEIGLDFSTSTFNIAPIFMAPGQRIVWDGNGGAQFNRSMYYTSGALLYSSQFGIVEELTDQGLMKVSAYENIVGNPGNAFTVSGCGTATSIKGGSMGGSFTVGTGASPCIFVITSGNNVTSDNGWACFATDETTGTILPQVAHSTTSCSIKGNAATNDVVVFSATGY